MFLQSSIRTSLRLGISTLLTLAALCAHAATATWTGAGGDNNFSTGANWGGTAPSAGDDLVFSGTTRLSPNAGSNLSINSLSFSIGAGAFTIGGNDLTIGSGGITNNSTSSETINNQLTLSANQTWNAASGAITTGAYVNANNKNLTLSGSSSVTVSGQLNNVATLTFSGSGNRSFGNQVSANTLNAGSTGTNTFSSQINVGTLNVSAGTTTFATVAASTGINVSGNANVNFAGAVNGGSNGIAISSSGAVNFTGSINSGSITLNGTGTTTLGGSGTMSTGAVVVNSGTLILDHTGGAGINNSLTVNNGGTVIFAENNQVPSWQTVTLNTGSTLYLGDTSQTFAGLVINGDSVIDFGTGGSQLNVTYNNISIANGVTLTIQNWNASNGDVFSGANPGANVVNVQYADSNGNIYATGTWGGGYVTPGTPVPEPSTYGLILLGSGTAFVLWRRRKSTR